MLHVKADYIVNIIVLNIALNLTFLTIREQGKTLMASFSVKD